jgi:D-arabinose 1-dehydrogenase-like Zn-dependent alcohol dehydrogenase
MVAPVEALVPIPDVLTDTEAAPLLCAGITTYNALRHSGALTDVRPMIETYPLEKAGDGQLRMMSGKAEFRVVLTM